MNAPTPEKTSETPPAGAKIPENEVKFAYDEQTGKLFRLKREDKFAAKIAGVSATYLILMLGFLLWLLFDTWAGRNQLLVYWGYDPKLLSSDTFRLLALVAIGGAIGGAVDGIRSIVAWHSEREAYGPRFIWKDLSLPLTGAAVGLLVYITVRGGAGAFSGDFSLSGGGGAPELAAFSVASLSGFSSQQVYRWFDAQANKLFRVVQENRRVVPDLSGKTVDEVKEILGNWKLTLGATKQQVDDAHVGKVVKQFPNPGAIVSGTDAIDITIGAKSAEQNR